MTTQYEVTRWSVIKTKHGTCSSSVDATSYNQQFKSTK